jgi:hypothetical protein
VKRLHLLRYINDIIQVGVKNLILDFSLETEQEMQYIITIYFAALHQKIVHDEEIKGVTYGHFQEAVI